MSKKPADAFRILHTADWHLGKMLNEQSREEEQKRFLNWLLKQVVELEVDVVLVAGDIFDTANPPQSAEALYYDFVAALHGSTSASLVLIGGNHDSANQLEAPKRVLQSLRTHVHGAVAEDPADRLLLLPSSEAPKVAIAMIPFLREKDIRIARVGESSSEVQTQVREGIIATYRETAEVIDRLSITCPVIATGHLTVAGSTSSESEREIHIGGLGAIDASVFPAQFAYVALGHLHRPQAPDKQGRVRYAGSPIPLSFSEITDKKEVRILDVANGDIKDFGFAIPVFRRVAQLKTTVDTLATDMLKFEEKKPSVGELPPWVEVVVSGLNGVQDVADQVHLHASKLPFEVLKVTLGDLPRRVGPSADGQDETQAIETLLDKPSAVFEHLLSQQEGLPQEKVDALRVAFAQLVEKDAQAN
jgi:exonuclease SbcD